MFHPFVVLCTYLDFQTPTSVEEMISHLKPLLVAIIIVLILWMLPFFLPYLIPTKEFDSGKFGDGFGSVSALFNGLGIVGLIYTILYQVHIREQDRKQDDFRFLYEHLTTIEKMLEETEFQQTKGAAAFDAIRTYLNQNNHNPGQDGAITAVFALILMVKAYREMLRKKMQVFDRDQYLTLRSRYFRMIARYLAILNRLPVKKSHVESGGDGIVIHNTHIFANDTYMLFTDEMPPGTPTPREVPIEEIHLAIIP